MYTRKVKKTRVRVWHPFQFALAQRWRIMYEYGYTPMTKAWFEDKFGDKLISIGVADALVPNSKGGLTRCHYVDYIDVPYIESIMWISPSLDKGRFNKRKIAQFIYENIDLNAITVTRQISFGYEPEDYKYLLSVGAINDSACCDLRFHYAFGIFCPDCRSVTIDCKKFLSEKTFSRTIIHELRHAVMEATIDGIADPVEYPESESLEDAVLEYADKVMNHTQPISI